MGSAAFLLPDGRMRPDEAVAALDDVLHALAWACVRVVEATGGAPARRCVETSPCEGERQAPTSRGARTLQPSRRGRDVARRGWRPARPRYDADPTAGWPRPCTRRRGGHRARVRAAPARAAIIISAQVADDRLVRARRRVAARAGRRSCRHRAHAAGRAERGWFEKATAVASGLMSIALLVLAVALVPAAWNFRKSYAKISDLLDRVYGDINPLMRHASAIADNVNYITTSVRTDVQQVNATIAAANQRLQQAVALTEQRLNEFNALLEVVQEEAESMFVATASTVRGVRTGAAALHMKTTRTTRRRGGPTSEELDDGYDDPDAPEAGTTRPRVRPRRRGMRVTHSTTCSPRPSSAPRSAPPPHSCSAAARRASARSSPVLRGARLRRAVAPSRAGAAGAALGARAWRRALDRIPVGSHRARRARDGRRGARAHRRLRPAGARATCAARSAASGSGSASDAPRRAPRDAGAAGVARRRAWCSCSSLLPHAAHAWTPGTHVFLGEAVLRSLGAAARRHRRAAARLPVRLPVRVDRRRHEHRQEVRPHRTALSFVDGRPRDPRRRARRADARLRARLSRAPRGRLVAHNHFVPEQLAVTASTSALGHSYWESRFETHLGPACARQARDLILLDHSRADGLLDRILSPTIFSTPTNRRIFRGMVHAADSEAWQRIFGLMTENSRWDLADAEVGALPRRARSTTSSTCSCTSTQLVALPARSVGRRRAAPREAGAARGAARRRRRARARGSASAHFGLPRRARLRAHARRRRSTTAEPRRQQLIELRGSARPLDFFITAPISTPCSFFSPARKRSASSGCSASTSSSQPRAARRRPP